METVVFGGNGWGSLNQGTGRFVGENRKKRVYNYGIMEYVCAIITIYFSSIYIITPSRT